MTGPGADSDAEGRRENRWLAAAALAVVALFLALRIAFLAERPPFFDELFTRWITSLWPHFILQALRHDSGPPFYYLLIRLVSGGGASVGRIRIVSLVSSAAALGVLALIARRPGSAPDIRSDRRVVLTAAALFAVYPPAVLAAADARAYALTSLFVAMACLALHGWAVGNDLRDPPVDGGGKGAASWWLLLAGGALVLAAASHYYGVLFFPLPAIVGVMQGNRRAATLGIAASLGCTLLYAPFFWLAAQQPAAAINWMGAQNALAPLSGLAFAANYPESLFPSVSVAVILAAVIALVFSLLRTGRSPAAIRFAAMTLVPVLGVVILSLAGRHVYFPLRFESILAAPLVLWLAFALRGWSPAARRVLLTAMLLIGGGVCAHAVFAWRTQHPDSYRAAAQYARAHVDPRDVIVAGGYAYLETISQRDGLWHPRVVSLPPQQAVHPGWYESIEDEPLRERARQITEVLPRVIFIGARNSGEMSAIAARGQIEILWSDGVVMVARVDAGH